MKIVPWFVVIKPERGWKDRKMEDNLQIVSGPFWVRSAAQESLDAIEQDPLSYETKETPEPWVRVKLEYDIKQVELIARVY